MDLKSLIEDYLKEGKLMQIATSKENTPWVASVWFVHDDKLNLFFISTKDRRHSKEIKENPKVAGTIVIPHLKGSGEKVRGLQFEGIARETNAYEMDLANQLYKGKYELAEEIALEELMDPKVTFGYYIIEPKTFVLFDEINFPDDPRQELKV
ncbi:MAG: pyridoxamine 5'-phosphate oxidase family protein [Candidatus Daviesbacteria bacterium]|nr:pyridoxamine 5'-phosphate oxidase family protein [Candidatus Daviesbacteria bacterium]